MNKKIVVIGYCTKCPLFDYEYYDYSEVCTQTGNHVPRIPDSRPALHAIPDDCPLPDYRDMLDKLGQI